MSIRLASLRNILFSMIIICLCVVHAHAQYNAGIQGTIQDKSGAVLQGATVTATNVDTGRAVVAKTSSQGFYRISGLPPGTYTMKVEQTGFKTISSNINVSAETIQGFNPVVELGAVAETVNVETNGTELETESGNVSGTITRQEIQRLPTVGRDPYELIRLAPGVFGDGARSGSGQSIALPNNAGPGGSNTSIFQTENQVQVSANGQRVSGNNYEVDGVNVNSLTWGGAAVVTPNEESVKEIKVTSSTYSAEEGRNSGAQVKVISQNGGNQFHGSAFFKYDEPGLNAYNKFTNIGGDTVSTLTCNKGTPIQFTLMATRCPDRVSNAFRNYGGSIGGPIIRNKLFFFFSMEGLRSNTTGSITKFIETPEFRAAIGNLRGSTNIGKVIATPGEIPRISALLPADCTNFTNSGRPCAIVGTGMDIGSITGAYGQYVSLGSPQGGGLDGVPDLEIAQIAVPNTTRGMQYNGRIDFNVGKNQFALSSYVTRQDNLLSDADAQARPIADLTFKPISPSVFFSWIRVISPTMLNEARVNFSRFAFNQVSSNPDANFSIPRIEIEGLPINDRIRFGAPRSETTPGVFAQNTYAFRDIFTKQLSKMVLKFGFESRAEQNNNNLLGGSRPIYSFSGLYNFANGTPIFEGINADPRNGQPADAQRYFRTKDYGVFFQDDWKFRPNLTLNLGLRWEYFSPLNETNDHFSNLILGSGANALTGATLNVGNQLTNANYKNFAPRIGFAWSPYNDSNMVVRGGFGVSYNRVPDVLFENTRGNPPFFARYGLCCGTAATDFGTPFDNGLISFVLGASNSVNSYPANPGLSKGIDPNTGLPLAGSVEIWGAAQHFPTPYIYNYSLETEMQLPASLVGTLGYEGSTSHRLLRIVNENFIFDTLNPKFSPVFFPTPDVNASYNSLNARLRRPFRNGFQVEGKYRWSKSIDELSNEGPGFQTNQTFPRDLKLERGPSDYDATHFVVVSALWDLPIFRNRKDGLGAILGGWQLNPIFTAHSGFPWTPVTFTQQLILPGGQNLGPIRPVAYFGGALQNFSTDNFLVKNGNFPGGGKKYFDITKTGNPGIGRNSFRGPRYSSFDFSFVKVTALPFLHLGEQAGLELRANMFNIFNKLNLAPFGFATPSTVVEDSHFGQATGAFAGRTVELQARFSF